jgi:hypothetical protein
MVWRHGVLSFRCLFRPGKTVSVEERCVSYGIAASLLACLGFRSTLHINTHVRFQAPMSSIAIVYFKFQDVNYRKTLHNNQDVTCDTYTTIVICNLLVFFPMVVYSWRFIAASVPTAYVVWSLPRHLAVGSTDGLVQSHCRVVECCLWKYRESESFRLYFNLHRFFTLVRNRALYTL